MVLIAVGNGAFRDFVMQPRLGELHARQASTVLLIVLFAIYMAVVFRRWPLPSARQAALVGAAWLALTLAFEFGLGHFVSGLSWRDMLADYDLLSGRLWILVPLWVALGPCLFQRWRR